MEDQDKSGFSWTGFFWVTGICFLLFTGLMKVLDGSVIKLFLRIGLISSGLGFLSGLIVRLAKKNRAAISAKSSLLTSS